MANKMIDCIQKYKPSNKVFNMTIDELMAPLITKLGYDDLIIKGGYLWFLENIHVINNKKREEYIRSCKENKILRYSFTSYQNSGFIMNMVYSSIPSIYNLASVSYLENRLNVNNEYNGSYDSIFYRFTNRFLYGVLLEIGSLEDKDIKSITHHPEDIFSIRDILHNYIVEYTQIGLDKVKETSGNFKIKDINLYQKIEIPSNVIDSIYNKEEKNNEVAEFTGVKQSQESNPIQETPQEVISNINILDIKPSDNYDIDYIKSRNLYPSFLSKVYGKLRHPRVQLIVDAIDYKKYPDDFEFYMESLNKKTVTFKYLQKIFNISNDSINELINIWNLQNPDKIIYKPKLSKYSDVYNESKSPEAKITEHQTVNNTKEFSEGKLVTPAEAIQAPYSTYNDIDITNQLVTEYQTGNTTEFPIRQDLINSIIKFINDKDDWIGTPEKLCKYLQISDKERLISELDNLSFDLINTYNISYSYIIDTKGSAVIKIEKI